MSFNHPHITITTSNYEAYFVLYVDNELSAEERAAVENFVLQYPELKTELDLLLSTKISAEEVTMEGKELLFSQSMKQSVIDESLLLYIDDELSAEEKE